MFPQSQIRDQNQLQTSGFPLHLSIEALETEDQLRYLLHLLQQGENLISINQVRFEVYGPRHEQSLTYSSRYEEEVGELQRYIRELQESTTAKALNKAVCTVKAALGGDLPKSKWKNTRVDHWKLISRVKVGYQLGDYLAILHAFQPIRNTMYWAHDKEKELAASLLEHKIFHLMNDKMQVLSMADSVRHQEVSSILVRNYAQDSDLRDMLTYRPRLVTRRDENRLQIEKYLATFEALAQQSDIIARYVLILRELKKSIVRGRELSFGLLQEERRVIDCYTLRNLYFKEYLPGLLHQLSSGNLLSSWAKSSKMGEMQVQWQALHAKLNQDNGEIQFDAIDDCTALESSPEFKTIWAHLQDARGDTLRSLDTTINVPSRLSRRQKLIYQASEALSPCDVEPHEDASTATSHGGFRIHGW